MMETYDRLSLCQSIFFFADSLQVFFRRNRIKPAGNSDIFLLYLPYYETSSSDVPSAVAYRVALAADEAFKDIIAEKEIRPSEPARIHDVNDGLYHVRAQSIDGFGLEGLPFGTVQVRVRINPVPPFVSVPVEGGEYRSTKMAFSWLKVSDAAGYALQIAADPDFKTIVEHRENITKPQCEVKDLPFSPYYFRVRSIAADGFKGIWSDGVRFVMSPPPPVPPTEPPEVGEKRITIRWRNQEPGMVYHFQMAEDREFTNIRVDEKLTSCEISLDKPKSSGTYFIRVRGIDVDGFEGRFSPAQTFEVEKDPKELWAIALLLGTVLAILLP